MSGLTDWREISEGVYVAVAQPEAVTIGLVVGADAALVVDTGSDPLQGLAIRQAVASVTRVPVSTAVLTHWHFDHALGLAAFDDVLTIGHETLGSHLATAPAGGPSEAADLAQRHGLNPSELTVPHRQIAVATAVDLGDRRVEIAHLGRGHTDGDLVVVVPDSDVLFAGDLIESAGPPWYGDDSFPHEWAATLDGIIGLMTAHSRAVPGHGTEVDREFVFQARGEVAAIAGEIRRLVEAGVGPADALGAGSWPYPEDHVALGVAQGYAQLVDQGVGAPRRTLPLA
ncbi:MAG TPA: MBL fold metallo-hydrolase [Propionibacteriaceae bacterium]|nr:MBL fold metallo-hydrolase [Propionibacteriaceae bacterium]